jgi:hypothetical protein
VARRPPDCADAVEPSLEEALARARRHAKSAVAEALEAARALLDAASLATSGAPADAHPLLARADRWIRTASRGWAADGGLSGELGAALAEALDHEIARWEQRARIDDDARAVLRAFLGLRELLWELGVRPPRDRGAAHAEGERSPAGGHAGAAASESASRPHRVERVAVQG